MHLRWLTGSIPDWHTLFAEAFNVTKPGGWVESHEPSSIVRSDHATIRDESALGQWPKIFHEGGKIIGRTFKAVEDDLQRKAMEAAGFVDIQEYTYKVGPIFSGNLHFRADRVDRTRWGVGRKTRY